VNDWRYFNKTDQNYSTPGPRYIDNTEKVIVSKVKVGERWPQKSRKLDKS